MKILSLKALNINSLKGKTEIDFVKLTQKSALFAITGATGSGKSSILDIISCALYGRTSRLKNPNDLMSRHTGEAYCEVEFEVKGIRYRSSWSQKRARKKHDGKFQTAKMELVDLDKDKIFALKSKEVPKKIEEISGLDFARFTQSMLLAQGGFDAFLKADEKERSALLQKITKTEIYADISIAVFEKHRSLHVEIESEKKVLDSIELLDEDTLHLKEKELAEILKDKQECDEVLQKLTLYKESQNRLEHSSKTLIKYKDEFQNLNRLQEKCSKEYEQIKKEFDEFSQIFENESEKLKTTRKMQTQERQIQESLIKIQQQLLDKKDKLQESKKALKNSIEKYDDISEKSQQKKNYISSHKQDDKLLVKLGVIEQNIEIYKEEQKRAFQSESELKTGKKLLLSYKEQEQKLQDEKSKLSVILQDRESKYKKAQNSTHDSFEAEEKIRKDLENTQNLLRELKLYRELNIKKESEAKEYSNYSEVYSSLLQREQTLQAHIKEIKKHIQTLQHKQVKEQLLKKYEDDRRELVEGEECFLCGSLEHPYSKNMTQIEIDKTKKMIDTELQELESQENKLKELLSQISVTKTKQENSQLELQKLDKEIKSLSNFSNDAEITLQEQKNNLLKELESIRQNHIQKAQLLKLRDEAKELFLEKEKQLSALHVRVQKATSQYDNLSSLYSYSTVKIENLTKELLESFKEFSISLDMQDIDSSFQKLLEKRDSYKQALQELEKLQENLNRYAVDKKENETRITSFTAEIQSIIQSTDELDENLKSLKSKRVSILNIADLDAYEREILSKYKNLQLKEQKKKISLNELNIKKYENLKQQKISEHEIVENENIKRHLESQNLLLKDKAQDEIQTLYALYRQKLSALQESIGSLKKELEINEHNSEKFQKRVSALKKKQDGFKTLIKLNELIGSADGTKFKKFAQGITLDQLIHLANRHLNVLTSRYTLVRNQEKLLELEVVDAYQADVIRGVNTLSGGESFIVSLALALGLSELASQRISIDSLFLDEGFGTLDEQSLEMALNALNLLQSSGKMIGVISHVEALKERIPLQIKVTPRGDGVSFIEIDSKTQ
jgi:exonuclease SbcC